MGGSQWDCYFKLLDCYFQGVQSHVLTRLGTARRIDCFSEWTGTAAFGEKMKEQVEERLRFYDEGIAPSKNVTAMQVCSGSPLRNHPSTPGGQEPVWLT